MKLPIRVLDTGAACTLVDESRPFGFGTVYSPIDAAYIVNAVNTHARLVEALEGMLEYFSEVAGDTSDKDQAEAEEEACRKAFDALSAAKGETSE